MNDQWTRRVWPPADDAHTPGPAPGGPAPASGGAVPVAGGSASASGGAEPAPDDDLPPSAVWYGTPVEPPRRLPRWLHRLLVAGAAVAAAAAVIAAAVFVILSRGEAAPPTMVADPLAGVSYSLPSEWSEGMVAPVTGFTSVAARGDLATVMARPEVHVDPAGLAPAVRDLSDLYAKLLLHGDEVTVVDDRDVTIGGRPGHTRAVRAEYRDVVNQPAFMRVTLLTRPDGKSTVLLGLAHPDDPRSRADIETVMAGVH
ncbi:hypothetical protein [Planotetraspora kaengkrachanensis]|uniref:Uncharacterized protein n=1 Tax=Planotetraspora kaengkrachanensis TaxID=575193 RepID=A0A8J3PVH6_9ACTN|nr:hypothetical protein [Planotetraspora kaengkrachanensis]GIG81818.1 hypothetical protein Pka01_49450 [Planotetraspora kaengkrachanensis]